MWYKIWEYFIEKWIKSDWCDIKNVKKLECFFWEKWTEIEGELEWFAKQPQWTSMCLVRSWYTGLAAIWRAAWLSYKSKAAKVWGIWRSWSKLSNQTISQVVEANERYSTYAEDWEMIVCFLDFQETKESPKKVHKPVTDFLVSGQPAQLES
jgi:hypothetical protein